ncbi:MAG: 3-deoxy-D-manno-octulosonic acid transferase [bacterium]
MNVSEWMYNAGIYGLIPASVIGTYKAFGGRSPDRNTMERIHPPDIGALPENPRIWLHGASVGEIQQVNKLLPWFEEMGYGTEDIIVSSQTRSGLGASDHPHDFILPFDYPPLLTGIYHRYDLQQLFVVETEIWPNLYRYHENRVTMVNARVKPYSFQYYRRVSGLVKTALSNCERILARTKQDARRFRVLTGKQVHVREVGPLKWVNLMEPPGDDTLDQAEFSSDRPVLVAGSTWPGEEELAIELARQLDMNLYIAPRHMDRLNEVRTMLQKQDIEWKNFTDASSTVKCRVVLVNKMGILTNLYNRADVVFVGGSWNEDVGGHNIIEPVTRGKPVVVGPHIRHVETTARLLRDFDLLKVFDSPGEARGHINEFLDQPDEELKNRLSKLRSRARNVKEVYVHQLKDILQVR